LLGVVSDAVNVRVVAIPIGNRTVKRMVGALYG
jgi:hypothetical protein